MGKKPLKLVTATDATQLDPPRKLGDTGITLWRTIQAEYGITDTGGVEMLLQACAAADRAEALAQRISEDGETIMCRSGLKAHPCLKDELAARAFVVRTLQKLGLNYEAIRPGVGRPGTPSGWSGPAG